jgi:hypothetical protein
MTNYNEFMAKTQGEILGAVKQAQETNVKAITSFGDAVAEYANKAKTMPTEMNMPTPTQVIESAFGFTAQLVEMQKNYYVKIAETFANAQKKATQAVSAPATEVKK